MGMAHYNMKKNCKEKQGKHWDRTFKWAEALSTVVKTPEDSTTYSAPKSAHGISAGSLYVHQALHYTLSYF